MQKLIFSLTGVQAKKLNMPNSFSFWTTFSPKYMNIEITRNYKREILHFEISSISRDKENVFYRLIE